MIKRDSYVNLLVIEITTMHDAGSIQREFVTIIIAKKIIIVK